MANRWADAVTYITGVSNGTIPACLTIKQAVQRHLSDLEHGRERGLTFDAKKADKALRFFNFLSLSKGVRKKFVLSGWQCFVIGSLMGWQKGGVRRFQTAYLECPKKSGKTEMLAGIGLMFMVSDDEFAKEIYSAATSKDQARLSFDAAVRMRDQSPELKQLISKLRDNLHIKDTHSKFQPLSSDRDSIDGVSPSLNLIDELHRHPDSALWNLLRDSGAARTQPLTIGITTAGVGEESFCKQQHNFAKQVLSGALENDHLFVFIAQLDEGAAWDDENEWRKCNPNLDVTVPMSFLRAEILNAKQAPLYENDFRRYFLCQWVSSETVFLRMEDWRACNSNDPLAERALLIEKLKGRDCIAGLDLAFTRDLSALVLVFPGTEADPMTYVLPYFYCDEKSVEDRSKRDKVPYEQWVKEGFLRTTQGNVTDFDHIRAHISELATVFNIREIAFDKWRASQLVTQLMGDGANMVEFGQGFRDMSDPTYHLLKLVIEHKLDHGNNPVLRWMAANLVTLQNSEGFVKPDKNKSTERIDGMTALIMALGRIISNPADSNISVYEDRGLITL